jgi:hypothetical protein
MCDENALELMSSCTSTSPPKTLNKAEEEDKDMDDSSSLPKVLIIPTTANLEQDFNSSIHTAGNAEVEWTPPPILQPLPSAPSLEEACSQSV